MTVPVSILIPTMPGRQAELALTIGGYQRTAPGSQICVTMGEQSWGAGLNKLTSEDADHDWLLFAPDDAVPKPGWLEAALAMWEDGFFPCARYLDSTGKGVHANDELPHDTPVTWTRLFLLPRALYDELGPVIDATWWADIEYSERIVDAGYACRICYPFAFTHLDGDRSWLTPEKEAEQRATYQRAVTLKTGVPHLG